MTVEKPFKLEGQTTTEGYRPNPEFTVFGKDHKNCEVTFDLNGKLVRFFLDKKGRPKTAHKGLPSQIAGRMYAKAAEILKGIESDGKSN